MKESHKNFAKAVAVAIETDENGVRKLLFRNGVKTDLLLGKKALSNALVDAIAKSQRVAVDFQKHLQSLAKESFQNAAGKTFGQMLEESQTMTSTVIQPTVATTPTVSNNNGFFSGLNLQQLLNTGLSALEIQRDIKVSQNEKDAIKTAVEIEREKLENNPAKGSNNTVIIIAAVLGIAAVGFVGYYYMKKK